MPATLQWHAEPTRPARQWPIFLPLLIPVVVLAGFAAFVLLSPAKPKVQEAPPGHVGSLIWGDGIFADNREMSAWLLLHGGRYPIWATRHPHGVKLITTKSRLVRRAGKHAKN